MTTPSATPYIEDAVAAARRAVEFDAAGQQEPAAYFYKVASKLLKKAAEYSEQPDKAASLDRKADEYHARADELQNQKDSENKIEAEDPHRQKLKRCHFLLQQGLEADAAGLGDTAVELYTNAIEYVTHNPELMQGELKELVLQALERAEDLKG